MNFCSMNSQVVLFIALLSITLLSLVIQYFRFHFTPAVLSRRVLFRCVPAFFAFGLLILVLPYSFV
jgi:hypothetical protein